MGMRVCNIGRVRALDHDLSPLLLGECITGHTRCAMFRDTKQVYRRTWIHADHADAARNTPTKAWLRNVRTHPKTA